MAELSPNISTITLNENGPNTVFKRQNWQSKTKSCKNMLHTKNLLQIQHSRLQVKRWKKLHHVNINTVSLFVFGVCFFLQKAGVTTSISDKAGFYSNDKRIN